MRIAVTSMGPGLESGVDPRFGRAKGFVVVEGDEFEYVENEKNMQAVQGAGIQAAGNIVNSKVEVLITGNVGPKAFMVLNKAGVKIFIGAKGTVKEALDDFQGGELKEALDANVEGHW